MRLSLWFVDLGSTSVRDSEIGIREREGVSPKDSTSDLSSHSKKTKVKHTVVRRDIPI